MSFEVADVLDKITEHNADTYGCIATGGEKVYHNLTGPYEMLDASAVSERARNILLVTRSLSDESDNQGDDNFDTAFLEYENHSLIIRALGDDMLILINQNIQRAGFKKLKVGTNLFLKPLERAIERDQKQSVVEASTKLVAARDLEEVNAPLSVNPNPPETPIGKVTALAEGDDPEHAGKTKRVYRGVVSWE